MNKRSYFKLVFFYIVCFFITLHLLLFFSFMQFPSLKQYVSGYRILGYYQGHLFLGPFFREPSIRSTTQFSFCYKQKSAPDWSDWRNLEKENFEAYWQTLNLNKIKRQRLEKNLAQDAYDGVNAQDSVDLAPLRLFSNYFLKEYTSEFDRVDSVKVLYLTTAPIRDSQILTDTLFYIIYNPNELE